MPLPRYKKQFWLVISVGIVLLILAGGGLSVYLVRYSATSERVCLGCHPDIIDLWKESNGHPAASTSCHECHSPGREVLPSDWNIGKHIRDQIAPPEYSADDLLTTQRCLDCHPEVLNLGYEAKKKVIKFTHRYQIDIRAANPMISRIKDAKFEIRRGRVNMNWTINITRSGKRNPRNMKRWRVPG